MIMLLGEQLPGAAYVDFKTLCAALQNVGDMVVLQSNIADTTQFQVNAFSSKFSGVSIQYYVQGGVTPAALAQFQQDFPNAISLSTQMSLLP